MNRIAAMDIGHEVGFALIAVIVPLVFYWLSKSAQAESAMDARRRVVTYSKAFKVFVVLCWVASAAICILAGFTAKDADIKNVFALVGLFTALILPLHLEVFGVLITWDETFIYTRSPWRKSRKIPISAVRSCDYWVNMQWYRIHTEGHGTIRLSPWAKGIPELLAMLPCSHPGYPPARPWV